MYGFRSYIDIHLFSSRCLLEHSNDLFMTQHFGCLHQVCNLIACNVHISTVYQQDFYSFGVAPYCRKYKGCTLIGFSVHISTVCQQDLQNVGTAF